MMPLVLLLGAGIGAGIYLALRALIPTQPALAAALDRLSTTHVPTQSPQLPPRGLEERLGAWAEQATARLPGVVTPDRDLALIGWTTRKFYGQKAMASLAGLLFPLIMGTLAYMSGLPAPIPLTVGAMLILAAIFFFLPDLEVRQRAATQRTHYRRIIAAYVDFVALSRIGGASATQAMSDAAAVGDNELFHRIQQLIERSGCGAPPPGATCESSARSSASRSSTRSRTSSACPARKEPPSGRTSAPTPTRCVTRSCAPSKDPPTPARSRWRSPWQSSPSRSSDCSSPPRC